MAAASRCASPTSFCWWGCCHRTVSTFGFRLCLGGKVTLRIDCSRDISSSNCSPPLITQSATGWGHCWRTSAWQFSTNCCFNSACAWAIDKLVCAKSTSFDATLPVACWSVFKRDNSLLIPCSLTLAIRRFIFASEQREWANCSSRVGITTAIARISGV